MSAKVLNQAKAAKYDEFYTRITDISKEIQHYREHFADKVVYCNCDDSQTSAFFEYFRKNFHFYGLKWLIATGYVRGTTEPIYGYSMNGKDAHHIIGRGGDFREQQSYLKEADIVITNPPFSLFREYLAQLIENDKKFIIIGDLNIFTNSGMIPLIREKKMWFGVNEDNGEMLFDVSKTYADTLVATKNEGSAYRLVDGQVKGRVGSAFWYTNLEHGHKPQDVPLTKRYTPEAYPRYDNYSAIEVGRVADIPYNWYGEMGVPISFLKKYNPDQFEIVDVDRELVKQVHGKARSFILNGKNKYTRIVIRRRFQS